MAGYIGTKAVNLSTTAATVGGDADIGGDLTVDTSTLHVDSTNNRVGVGTILPISKLEVNSGDIRINDQTNGATRKIYFDMKNSGGAQTDFSLQANNGNFSFYSESTGSERMRIDSAGRVTKPYQPSFRAYRATAGNVTYGAGNIVSASMTSTNYNVGGHYNTSNGRFTAPIAGRYLFWCALYNNSSLSGRRIRADINGGAGVWGQNQSSSGSDWTASGIADLSTGDYVHMVSAYSDTVVFHDVNHSIWGGYLIG